jgi:hypothetical protein
MMMVMWQQDKMLKPLFGKGENQMYSHDVYFISILAPMT